MTESLEAEVPEIEGKPCKKCSEPIEIETAQDRTRSYHKACAPNKPKPKSNRRTGRPRKDKTTPDGQRPETAPKQRRQDTRRGAAFRRFVDGDGPRYVQSKGYEETAEMFGVDRTTVVKWMQAHEEDERSAKMAKNWSEPEPAKRAKEDFRYFRERYFRTIVAGQAEKYITSECHQRWIDGLLHTIEHGERLAIMAPIRHGKTELLAHAIIWLIIKNPNIRVLWVSKSQDLAKEAVRLVRSELENNEALRNDFLAPGEDFQPPQRSGYSWTDEALTVYTRNIVTKSPTVVAIGSGGTTIGRDCDLIVSDDIEDQGLTRQPAVREKTKNWWNNDLSGRKEEHTAWFCIGSRQHPEDLYSMLIESPEWEVIVEQAHDPACTVPDDQPAEHVDCLLFPEKRSYKWLLSQRRAEGERNYELKYQNNPQNADIQIFRRSDIEECYNRSRILGERSQLPQNRPLRLIAGFDPARGGYQAAVLWAVDVETNMRYLLDLENEKAGAVEHMRDVFQRWHEKYRLMHWVYEANGAQSEWLKDRQILDLQSRLGIKIQPHTTHAVNKWDNRYGVTSLQSLFEQRLIDLPYGNEESARKCEQLRYQFCNFSTEKTGQDRAWNTDIVMACWFPEETVQRWQHGQINGMNVHYARDSVTPWSTNWSNPPFTVAGGWGR